MVKKVVAAVLMAAVCREAAAETWYLIKSNSVQEEAVFKNLSFWQDANGNACDPNRAPNASDDLVVQEKSCRIGDVNVGANSVTLDAAILTVDGAGTTTWGNEGLFLTADSRIDFKSYTAQHPFDALHTIYFNGKVTITSASSSRPANFNFNFTTYSNQIYQVAKLIGAEGTYVSLTESPNGDNKIVKNNTFKVVDTSDFKGNFTAAYTKDEYANQNPLKDNGEYGGRVVFSGLDTPGTLTIGKNWTLGGAPNMVTRAGTVSLGDGARLEVMLAESGVSRLEAASELTLGGNVEIFLTGAGEFFPKGRYPIIVSPTALELSAFTLKALPLYSKISAELEVENSGGVHTLYLKVENGYGSYYVDAENGNDDWDGSVAAIPGEEALAAGGVIAGPKRTLAAAVAIAGFGHIVYAAEGVYDEGEMYAGVTTSNRVVVPAGVTLAASGRREYTIIKGKASEQTAQEFGTNALRCVALQAGAVVKGFTLSGGRTSVEPAGNRSDNGHWNGGAVWGIGRGLLVDCVVTNCDAARRGGNFYGKVTTLRCEVFSPVDRGANSEMDYYGGGHGIDTIIHSTGNLYYGCQFMNCTFTKGIVINGDGSATMRAIVRNCLHLQYASSASYIQRSTVISNSCFCSAPPDQNTYGDIEIDDASRFNVSPKELNYGASAYRPLAGSVAIGKGDKSMYLAVTNDWPATMRRQFTLKDVYGNDRFAGGALDLGAVQHRTGKACRYVDAAGGSDENDGLSAQSAKRTLKGVFESWIAEGDYEDGVVYAAPGEYNEGEMFYGGCSNRVVVPPAMGLIATGGPAVTTIRGRFGELENDSRAGDAAVRCVYLCDGAYIQGFKITGGATQKNTSNDSGLYGGGVYSENGAAIACEITGNAGGKLEKADGQYRGPGGFGGTYIGCYVHGNIGHWEIYHSANPHAVVVINSVLTGNVSFYSSGAILNSTIYGRPDATSHTYGESCAWNCYFEQSGRARVYTNCFFKAAKFDEFRENESKPINNGYDETTCRFGVSDDANNFDDRKVPKAGSPVVDEGSRELYDEFFPAKWAQFKDVGFLGEQRVYNGAIDVGGGEYDVRGEFAKALHDNGKLEVKTVGAFSTLSDEGVVLANGETMEMDFIFSAAGNATLTVTGEVTVTVDGVEMEGTGGVYAFYGLKGSTHSVKVVNRGEAGAIVAKCFLPPNGLQINFR